MRYEILENGISSEVVDGKQALYARWEELIQEYGEKGAINWCIGFYMQLRDRTVISVVNNKGRQPPYNKSEWKNK